MTEKNSNLSKNTSIWLSAHIYIVAIFIANLTGSHYHDYHPLIIIGVGDLSATIVVYIYSVMLNNSSAYDPYWSVKPIVIAVAYLYIFHLESLDARQWLVLTGTALYALRLTSNFYRDWPGFSHEDWRYVNFRKISGKAYWLVSFLAIHLFPTIMVYLGCMALFTVFSDAGRPLNLWDVLATIILFGSVVYAFIADEQLRDFRKNPGNKGKTISSGLWSLSRHPNYFGEISTWWGLAIFAIAAGCQYWWALAGPVVITIMFIFASIPLIEKRNLVRREGYKDYRLRTPMLLPVKFKKKFILICTVLILPLIIRSQQYYRVTPDVVYGHKAGLALTYDVFQPVDSANGAGIIHVVSGSWNSRYMPPDTVVINYKPLLDEGFTVFALRHGSNPQFKLPEAVDDVILGTWNIHDHAAQFGVDSSRLGIFGGSSGGQLALMAGLSSNRHPVSAIVAFFPPADLRKVPDFLKAMIPALDFDTTLAAGVSPVTFASPDDPPTLLIHGDKDFVVQPWQSERMYDSLQSNQVVSKLIIYKGMMHGNSYGAKGKYYEEANREMIAWFRKYLLDIKKPGNHD
jgi:steroid 5-alpha reductase family enzyme/acetyl esterase/lipase